MTEVTASTIPAIQPDSAPDLEVIDPPQNCLLACIDALVPGGCPPELRAEVIHNSGDMHEVASMIALALYRAGWIPDIGIIPDGMRVVDLFQNGVAVNNEHYADGERFFGVIVQTSDTLVPRRYEGYTQDADTQGRVERHVIAGVPLAESPDGTRCLCVDTLHSAGPRLVIQTSSLDMIAIASTEPRGMRGLLISGNPRITGDISDAPDEKTALLGDLEKKWQELVSHPDAK